MLVTEVPMLAPMIIGMDNSTVRTVGKELLLYIVSNYLSYGGQCIALISYGLGD